MSVILWNAFFRVFHILIASVENSVENPRLFHRPQISNLIHGSRCGSFAEVFDKVPQEILWAPQAKNNLKFSLDSQCEDPILEVSSNSHPPSERNTPWN
jgi:hypothetical protein